VREELTLGFTFTAIVSLHNFQALAHFRVLRSSSQHLIRMDSYEQPQPEAAGAILWLWILVGFCQLLSSRFIGSAASQ
jgi:hypothetical protein